MDALDGNAIGGDLLELFGREMTTSTAVCASCGARSYLAEVVVYTRAPGTVARCRSCGAVLIVVTRKRELACLDLRGLASLEQAR